MESTKYVPYEKTVNITEKRAPTDESVRLLNEFEGKAKNNIVSKIHIDENYIKAVMILFQEELISDSLMLYGRFILNGKEYRIEHRINKYEFSEKLNRFKNQNEEIIKVLHKTLSEAIALEFMKQLPEQLNKIFK